MADGVRIGPTGVPERSLAEQVGEWCYQWLRQPDGPAAGRPWEFTDEQFRFALWWFAFDESGRWLYRTATLRRVKGWGKDPLGAVLCAVEFLGPCRVSGGVGVTNPAAWVQTVAVAKDQTRNTMRLLPGLLSPELQAKHRVDMGKEIVYARGGRSVIEAVTSSPSALEGGRTTFTLMNETQEWQSNNDGHAMAETVAGNLAKSRDGAARSLAICNGHRPGKDSVAERDYDAWRQIEQGRSRAEGMLYDSLEAPAGVDLTDESSLRAGLRAARGDSHWLDEDRLVAEVWDPRRPASESRRKHLNQIVAAEDAWLAPHEWDQLSDATVVVADGDMVTLGFDGSKSDDHTALVGCRVDDGHVFAVDVWDPESHGGEAPRERIDAAVHRAFDRWDVVAFYADLHPWESYVDRWADEHGDDLCAPATAGRNAHSVAWDMRARTAEFTRAAERFHDAVLEGEFTHDGDSRLRQHVHNARRRPNRWGVSLGKEHRESARKIDAAVTAVLARLARQDYLALPDKRKRRTRTGKAAFF